ncbi:hypothetical protein Daus18300_000293 [Diaporthe australafricana]|uniref:Fungal N-terminal domain-containing protein n=1 Tax=Diaporthe australafricana TaxID=127596 RepID=A0ABR3Y5M1_9PEZI
MDPLSLASGAGGLVSLGITICNGLISYCRSYRSREDDISILQGNAERLRRQLEVLEGPQHGVGLSSGSPSLEKSMDECIAACNTCLADLGRLSDKFSPPVTGLNQRSRTGSSLTRKLSYPLQKDKFESFRRQVHQLHLSLSFQVGLLNHDAVMNLRQETKSESQVLSSIVSAQGRDIQEQIAAVVPDLSKILESGLTKSEQYFQAQMDRLEVMIKESLHTEERAEPNNTRGTGGSSIAEALPQAFSNELEMTSHVQNASFPGRKYSTAKTPLWELKCHCAGTISPAYPVTHATSCYLSLRHRQRRALIGKIRLFNYFFQFQVAIEYSQRAFLRTLHIQHNITIRATVPDGSPAFGLIHGTTFNMGGCSMGHYTIGRSVGGYFTVNSFRQKLQSCLEGLQRLFMEGRAWPTDIEESTGNNLLHVATSALWILMADEMKEVYSQFLQTLVDFGVPLKDASRSNQTPIGIVLQEVTSMWGVEFSDYTVGTGLVKGLLDLGADILDIMPLQTFGPSVLPLVGNEELEEQGTSDQEPLSRAVLEKWETQLYDILTHSDAKMHLLTRGKVGETPLHIATHWPRGMEMLLQLGGDTVTGIINAEDDNGSTALDYALKLREPECVRMLLDSSAEMDLEVLENIAKWESDRAQMDIVPVLTLALVQRRKKLLCLANECMKESTPLDNMSRDTEELIQEDAFEVVQALEDQGIHLPKEFRSVQPGSVYHCAYMNDETTESLFRAGFSHTNIAFLGFTPLMTIDLYDISRRDHINSRISHSALGLVDWFLSHGEDLNRPIPANAVTQRIENRSNTTTGVRLAHRVASEMGRSLRYVDAFGSERYIEISQRILTSPVLDSCECLCTQNGCSAASVFSREVWKVVRWTNTTGKLSDLDRKEWATIMDLLRSRLSGHPGARQFALDFIRVSTFEQVGMSHTCCRFMENSGKYESPDKGVTMAILRGEYKIVEIMDAEDVAEIQEEERFLGKLFEALMKEFDAKFEELGLSLSDFFFSYWWPRMAGIEAENKVTQEELTAIRNMGVVLEVI